MNTDKAEVTCSLFYLCSSVFICGSFSSFLRGSAFLLRRSRRRGLRDRRELGGDAGEFVAHGGGAVGVGEDLDRLLEAVELDLADQHACRVGRAVAVAPALVAAAGDLDAAAVHRDALVQPLEDRRGLAGVDRRKRGANLRPAVRVVQIVRHGLCTPCILRRPPTRAAWGTGPRPRPAAQSPGRPEPFTGEARAPEPSGLKTCPSDMRSLSPF